MPLPTDIVPSCEPYLAMLPRDTDGTPMLGLEQRLEPLPLDPAMAWEDWAPWVQRWPNPEPLPPLHDRLEIPSLAHPDELYQRLRPGPSARPVLDVELNDALRRAVEPFSSTPSTGQLMRQELSVALLLARGAVCSVHDTLVRAVLNANPRLVYRLLRHRDTPRWDDTPPTFRESPLLALAVQGSPSTPAIVRLLIDDGASPNTRDREQGRTALHWVMINPYNQRSSLACVLLDAGADVHARNRDGHTAMHYAAARNDVASLNVLHEHGANPAVHTSCPTGPAISLGRVMMGFETPALAQPTVDDERSTWVPPSVVRPPRPGPEGFQIRPGGWGLVSVPPPPTVTPAHRVWHDTPMMQAAYFAADDSIAWLLAHGVDPCPPLPPLTPEELQGPCDERVLALLEGAWRRAHESERPWVKQQAEQGRALVERALLRIDGPLDHETAPSPALPRRRL